jgi:peptidoglycan/LPS O-acetylase OafA/YrhL
VLNEKSVRKYDFIDTLRGLAILGVILIHTGQWIPPANPVLNTIAVDGAQGVQLFFIASALTLFLSMRSRHDNESAPVRNFFIRRFFRIAPMYYLALLFFVVVDGFSKRYFAPFGVPWYYPLLTATFLNGWRPETINSIIPGGWSISVEMTFYLFVPFLFVFLKDLKRTILFILAALVVGWLLNLLMTAVYTPRYPQADQYLVSSFTFFWFFSQLPVFGIGILVYHLFQRWKGIHDRGLGIVLLITAVFLEWAFLDTNTYGEIIPHHVMMAVGFIFVVFGLYFSNLRLLINPLTVWIGKLSFSMYLVHFALLRLLQEVIFPKGFPIGGDVGLAAGYILLSVLTVVLSVVTYHFVEKPGMDLGKALIDRLETAHASAHAPSKESQ